MVMMALPEKLNMFQNALCISASWLEWTWNADPEHVPVAVMGINLEDLSVHLTSNNADSVSVFHDKLTEMMESVKEVDYATGG
jgi:hypothetical protein